MEDVANSEAKSPKKLNVSISHSCRTGTESASQEYESQDYPSQGLDDFHFANTKQESSRPSKERPEVTERSVDSGEEMIVEFPSKGPATQPKVYFRVPKRVIAPFQAPKRQTPAKCEAGMNYVYCGEVDGKFGFLSTASKIPFRMMSRCREIKDPAVHNVTRRLHGETEEFKRAMNMWVKPTVPVSYALPARPLTSPDRVRCLSARRAAASKIPAGVGLNDYSQYLTEEHVDKNPFHLTDELCAQIGDAPIDEFGDGQPEEENQQPEVQDKSLAGEQDLEAYLRWLKQKAESPRPPKSSRTPRPKTSSSAHTPTRTDGGGISSPARTVTPVPNQFRRVRPLSSTSQKSDKFGPVRRTISVEEAETRGKSGSRVGIMGTPLLLRTRRNLRESSQEQQQLDLTALPSREAVGAGSGPSTWQVQPDLQAWSQMSSATAVGANAGPQVDSSLIFGANSVSSICQEQLQPDLQASPVASRSSSRNSLATSSRKSSCQGQQQLLAASPVASRSSSRRSLATTPTRAAAT